MAGPFVSATMNSLHRVFLVFPNAPEGTHVFISRTGIYRFFLPKVGVFRSMLQERVQYWGVTTGVKTLTGVIREFTM